MHGVNCCSAVLRKVAWVHSTRKQCICRLLEEKLWCNHHTAVVALLPPQSDVRQEQELGYSLLAAGPVAGWGGWRCCGGHYSCPLIHAQSFDSPACSVYLAEISWLPFREAR